MTTSSPKVLKIISEFQKDARKDKTLLVLRLFAKAYPVSPAIYSALIVSRQLITVVEKETKISQHGKQREANILKTLLESILSPELPSCKEMFIYQSGVPDYRHRSDILQCIKIAEFGRENHLTPLCCDELEMTSSLEGGRKKRGHFLWHRANRITFLRQSDEAIDPPTMPSPARNSMSGRILLSGRIVSPFSLSFFFLPSYLPLEE
ncbi:hypothetical protein CEXT_484121 [Caerostris extrusa]|uniref:Uncharacterized protein n=1 Tax=Caerostris extrusa TaxID=172846 RepID=A0AAV4NXH0_CAEEX|nr:hypothetical protein CEXT_484121 [Caerostris extrusa]